MQIISFLLFRLYASVVKNHLKREKNFKKKIIFSLYHHPPPPDTPRIRIRIRMKIFARIRIRKKKCGSETLVFRLTRGLVFSQLEKSLL